MRDSNEKKCVTCTTVIIILVACVVLGFCIYTMSRPTSDVQVMPTNTTIPRPDLLTKTANIAKNTIKPLQSITSSEADDTDLSGI